MKTISDYTKEISKLTLEIEQKYPELYEHLDENPMTIPNEGGKDLSLKEMEEYLNGLKKMVREYKEKHSEEVK
jgi:hypothetical protein